MAVGHLYVVQSESRISPRPESPTAFLSIRYYTTAAVHRFTCHTALTCSQPLDLLDVPENRSPAGDKGASAFFSVIKDLVSGSPQRLSAYAHLISRSPAKLQDAVALLSATSLDLTEAFANVEKGTYLLDFCPITYDGTPQCPSLPSPITVVLNDRRTVVEGSAAKSGLQMVYLCKPIGNRVFRSEGAMVLAATEPLHTRLGNQLAEARILSQHWPADEALPHLRLFLLGLSRPFRE
jgi:hypothetical protein